MSRKASKLESLVALPASSEAYRWRNIRMLLRQCVQDGDQDRLLRAMLQAAEQGVPVEELAEITGLTPREVESVLAARREAFESLPLQLGELKRMAAEARKVTLKRDEAILAAWRAGASIAELAEGTGLAVSKVGRIVATLRWQPSSPRADVRRRTGTGGEGESGAARFQRPAASSGTTEPA